MCTKKTLYAPGIDGHVTLRTKEHGGKLNFDQISYTTDCIREVANVWNISILAATRRLRDIKGAFPKIYRESRRGATRLPARSMAKQLCSMG